MILPRRKGSHARWTWQDLATRIIPSVRLLKEEEMTELSNAALWLTEPVFFLGGGKYIYETNSRNSWKYLTLWYIMLGWEWGWAIFVYVCLSLRQCELPKGKGHQHKAWHMISICSVSLNWPGIVLNLIKLVENILCYRHHVGTGPSYGSADLPSATSPRLSYISPHLTGKPFAWNFWELG